MRTVWVMGACGFATLGAVVVLAPEALGQHRGVPAQSPAALSGIEQALQQSFPDRLLPEPRQAWRARLAQDEIMRVCSQFRNKPPKRVATTIQRIVRAGLVLPADGIAGGDWRRGEAIAQDGAGQRFTDSGPERPNGGNCYACHQLSPAEAAHGTLGPNLSGYGKLHEFSPATARKVYEHIWNPHMHTPCSSMPRFGASATLTPDQIRDLVALVMARESPVNR